MELQITTAEMQLYFLFSSVSHALYLKTRIMLWKGNKTQSSLHFSSFSSKAQILILWTLSLVLGRSGH